MNAADEKCLAAYALLVKSLEERLADAGRKRDAHDEAVRTLQSERDANAILTAENAALAKDAARYRQLRQVQLAVGHGSITIVIDDRCVSGVLSKQIWLGELDAVIDAAIASKEPAP